MKENTITDFFKKMSPTSKLVGIVLVGLFLIGVTLIAQNLSGKKEQAEITQDQIKIQKGDDIVIINRNGLVEYRSKDKVFYRTWDSAKIDLFFASMEEKARDYLADSSNVDAPGCYLVTLWLDGELVTICITDDTGELEEIYEEFANEDGDEDDGSLDDYFDDENDNWTGSETPTPTLPAGVTPTPTPVSESSPEDNYPPIEADCVTWSQDIVGKAIISNTLCTVEE